MIIITFLINLERGGGGKCRDTARLNKSSIMKILQCYQIWACRYHFNNILYVKREPSFECSTFFVNLFYFAACHVNTKELSHCYAVYFTQCLSIHSPELWFSHLLYSFLFWWINHFLIMFLLIHERETQKRNVCAIELYLILYM